MYKNMVFCLCCKNSQENKVESFLKQIGYNTISALSERKVYNNGKFKTILRTIIPGYVFFENDTDLDAFNWKEICKMEYIYYPLKYMDNGKILRGKDLEFVNWLKENNGILKISNVIKYDKKIKIINGPLKEYEGKIVKINKKQNCAGIKLDGEGIQNTIWLSYDYINGEEEKENIL